MFFSQFSVKTTEHSYAEVFEMLNSYDHTTDIYYWSGTPLGGIIVHFGGDQLTRERFFWCQVCDTNCHRNICLFATPYFWFIFICKWPFSWWCSKFCTMNSLLGTWNIVYRENKTWKISFQQKRRFTRIIKISVKNWHFISCHGCTVVFPNEQYRRWTPGA